MAWIYLILAGLCEMAWIVILKAHGGFTKLVPSIFAIIFAFTGPFFASLAMKTLGIGTSYAVWIGINSILLLSIGVVYFGETLSVTKVACVALIVIGAIGLKMLDAGIIKA